ncbi:MAG: UDP-3-O-(3-hydroxymyristoyl)glucosamine N-acyltransferase [Pseudomonadota bacterium]
MPDPRFFSVKPAISVADLLLAVDIKDVDRHVHPRDATQLGAVMVSRVAAPTAPSLSGACIFIDKKRAVGQALPDGFALCLVARELLEDFDPPDEGIIIGVDHVRALFSRITDHLYTEEKIDGRPLTATASSSGNAIHPTAFIDPRAQLGEGIEIGPGVVIGPGVAINDGCRIDAHCSIFHTLMGPGCVLAPGVRLGQAGFGVVPGPDGPMPMPQLGRVVIGARVHLGANTTVDRGSLEDTVIGDDCHIDNLVQIAHNVTLGRRCLIAAQTGISGSCHIGDDVVMGGQVGFADHLRVGNGAQIAAKAGIMHDIPAGETWCGVPAKPIRQFMREVAALGRLTQKKK